MDQNSMSRCWQYLVTIMHSHQIQITNNGCKRALLSSILHNTTTSTTVTVVFFNQPIYCDHFTFSNWTN